MEFGDPHGEDRHRRRRARHDGPRGARRAPARTFASAVVTVLSSAALLTATSACTTGSTRRQTAPPHSAPGTAAPSPSTAPAAGAPGWTTYGGGFDRTSADTADAPRATSPRQAWRSEALDGAVDGEALLYRGGVFVATENNTVYGLSASDGAPLWPPSHLAAPVPATSLPCGNLSPTVGVTSTMVVDPATGVLFASAETSSGGRVRHALYALDTSTGRVLWSRDLDQAWDPAAQLQRAALALSDGHVLVGFGGNYGDCGDYHGWVLGVPESGSDAILHYRIPTARQGAVWAASGVSVDTAGNVFVATGNGSALPGQAFDHGNSVVELSPQLAERRYFAPAGWAQDNASDADLGSTAPVLLGGGRVFTIGKQGTGFLLDAQSLGGIGGQLASLGVCPSLGGNAYEAPNLYVACTEDGRLAQVQAGPGAALGRGWSWTSPTGGAGSPTIAGGVVWSIDRGASMLYGIDPGAGTTRFTVPLQAGSLGHFVAVSAAGGLLVVAGGGGVEAFR